MQVHHNSFDFNYIVCIKLFHKSMVVIYLVEYDIMKLSGIKSIFTRLFLDKTISTVIFKFS